MSTATSSVVVESPPAVVSESTSLIEQKSKERHKYDWIAWTLLTITLLILVGIILYFIISAAMPKVVACPATVFQTPTPGVGFLVTIYGLDMTRTYTYSVTDATTGAVIQQGQQKGPAIQVPAQLTKVGQSCTATISSPAGNGFSDPCLTTIQFVIGQQS
jgi:D-alanyl-D-alanine carboxypeptidase